MSATVKLRKVGGSTILTIPPLMLDALSLAPQSTVEVIVEAGRLVVTPGRPRYTLDALLAETVHPSPQSDENRNWIEGEAAGTEDI